MAIGQGSGPGGELTHVGFRVQGEQQLSRALQLFRHEAADLSEPLDRMADVILKAIGKQFSSEGAAGLGTPWAPLSPDYAEWKAEHYPGRPLLVRTGDMRRAMLDKAQSVVVTKKHMTYSAGPPAGWHQDGTPRMPARPPVALTTEQKRRAVDRVFSQWVHELRRGPLWGPL